jgi:hypothetical protein
MMADLCEEWTLADELLQRIGPTVESRPASPFDFGTCCVHEIAPTSADSASRCPRRCPPERERPPKEPQHP